MSANDVIPPPPQDSARTIAVVTVIAALIAGVMIGIVGDRVWLWQHRGHFAERAGRAMTPRILARLDSELNLSPVQHAEVARILDAHRQRINAIMGGVRPQMRHEIDQANAEIAKILTPDQRAKFERLKMRMGPGGQHPPRP